MRISISNIAWDPSEDDAVAALLRSHGVDAIDVAPGKYFPDPPNTERGAIERVREDWAERGLQITGMQALLFGTTGLNLFGPAPVRRAMLDQLDGVCRIGAGLGATRLVFGSPRNRDRSGLTDEGALEAAVPFFRQLGDLAGGHGVVVCLEPNPEFYGANFMVTSAEAARVVRAVSHPAIRLQLDTGALAMNGESPASVVERDADLIAHVHASEPRMVPLGDDSAPHAEVAALLRRHLPEHVVAVEMLATRSEPHLVSIDRALRTAVHHYRPPS